MSHPTQTTRIKADINPREKAKPVRSFRTRDGGIATVQFTANGGALVRMPDGTVTVLSAREVQSF